MIHGHAGNLDAAKDAFGRALSEDLTFYQAHLRLAEIAMGRGDTTTALGEFDQAAQLRPNDGMVRFEYGVALLRAKKFAEGEAQLRKTTELEPYFAMGFYDLALALDLQGKKHEAIEPYKMFVARAPQSAQTQIEIAKARSAQYAAMDTGASTKP
jgi:Tfp pilus assembly protein PilF